MIKPIFLVPRQAVREMYPSVDTERMIQSGSWVQVPAHALHPPTKATLRQRRCRARKKAMRDKVTKGTTD